MGLLSGCPSGTGTLGRSFSLSRGCPLMRGRFVAARQTPPALHRANPQKCCSKADRPCSGFYHTRNALPAASIIRDLRPQTGKGGGQLELFSPQSRRDSLRIAHRFIVGSTHPPSKSPEGTDEFPLNHAPGGGSSTVPSGRGSIARRNPHAEAWGYRHVVPPGRGTLPRSFSLSRGCPLDADRVLAARQLPPALV
jgi:hypothetical protein